MVQTSIAVGAGHARDQQETGIGFLLVPEQINSRAWPAPTILLKASSSRQRTLTSGPGSFSLPGPVLRASCQIVAN
jgi:hypothetical protein